MAKNRKPPEQWQLEDARRLKALFEAREPKLSQMEFGAKYAIGSQGYVGQLLNAHSPLSLRHAKRFAKGLNCKVADFSPRLAAELGEDLAAPQALDSEEQTLLESYRQAPNEIKPAILALAVTLAQLNQQKRPPRDRRNVK